MKYSKYFVIAVGALVALLFAVWFLRNSLIERMSSSQLAEYGLTLTDVSLDAMSSSNATISYLELVHENGTTIAISNLSLPISGSSARVKSYSAEQVTIITATRDEEAALELALLIDQFLSLPDILGDIDVSVGELAVPPYPAIRDLNATLRKNEQRLGVVVDGIAMLATITPSDDGSHALVFSLPQESPGAQTHAIDGRLLHSVQGISLGGQSKLDLPAWQALAQLAGIVPQEIVIQSGTADLQFMLEIPYDTSQSASVSVELEPSPPIQLVYTNDTAAPTTIKLRSGSTVFAAASFPEIDWSLRQQNSSLIVSYDDWTEIPVQVTDLSCKAGPQCSLRSSVALKARALPVAKVGQLAWSSAETVVFLDDSLRIDLQAGGTFEASDVLVSDTRIRKVSAQLSAGATLELLDSGWRLAADSVDASVENMSVSDAITVSMPLYLENLSASALDEVLYLKTGLYVPKSTATLESGTAKLPGFKGALTYANDSIVAELATLGLHQNGSIALRHNLNTGKGQVDLAGAGVSFAAQGLSTRLTPWPYDWDVTAGLLFPDANASWTSTDSETQLTGHAVLRAEGLAGRYTDIAFVNLSTGIEASYDSTAGLSVNPASLTVGLLDTGVALENISADLTIHPKEMAVDVAGLHMSAFGGTIQADPFSFRTAATTNTVTMNAEAIRLDRLLTLEEFSAVKVSGTVGATLPITIEGDSITISNGKLFGEPPGGVIRYQPEAATGATDASSIGFVTRALGNFEYKTLTSDIEYNADGDLKLQLQLTGKSPAVDENRPIVLNLGVENNVPQMLKSLRAARSVEEILEKRLQK